MTRRSFETRLVRLRELAGLTRGEWVLVSDLDDIRYLSGFSGSNGWLLVSADRTHLITDGRYVEQATAETEFDVVEARSVSDMIAAVAERVDGTLLFQSTKVSVELHAMLSREVSSLRGVGSSFVELRRAKDDDEIAVIERAVAIADRALAAVCPQIEAGCTERDVRDELDYTMRRLGADGPSYDTIVASGPVNSARPHHRATDRQLEVGDALVVDVGALVDGYHSDLTRTFFIGECPDELRRRYDLVRQSQNDGILRVGPGVPCRDVDEACRKVFRAAELEDDFVHGTGHGVGLVIHEEPFLGRTSGSSLRARDVVTVEPGLYRVGIGGIRIEDLLVVSEVGSRVLSTFPKDLTCLPSRPTI